MILITRVASTILLLAFVFAWDVRAQTANPITEITFKHWGSWFPQTFLYVLRDDGTATLTVDDLSRETRTTTLHAKFDDFEKLAAAIDATRFFKMKNKYSRSGCYDAGTIIISAVRNRKRKTVLDYCAKAPGDFLALEAQIRNTVERINWEK